ncbi:prolipoprotein diacylglyceryl transferase [Demequina zhanjiangensis]|uniref:Phosphatidylglycerol--prolipoprotein diacylglyceryl transferase n=1 Tax=Demequina zhanjiangensis TaxID=3051659 RepID=A0ABT8G1Y3_9MICO|nr:prolipoprotein diacylglyceryl transferase [Demequina sp. SYSU T00b26]MDN4473143.1 prolipoprotein diacylglyceryl transferase [Demequina sp. SYSU T00b26]
MRASIPSPPIEWSSVSLGPLTIHMYAIFILIGIFVALWLVRRRWIERGGDPEVVESIAFWAIPFGIIGGRIYHVISSPAAYFGENGNPIDAFKIWEGGLGIWGAVALGAFGAWIGARRAGASFTAFADSVAPAVLLAQAIGRLGNYFNQELFGGPTDLPWGLEIEEAFRPAGYEAFTTFHPTFLYEMLWNLAGVAVLLWADRRFKLWGGRVFWLYVAVYTAGRLWIETVRIDTAVHVLGLRINVWVAGIVLLGAIIAFLVTGARQRRLSEVPDRATLAAVGASGAHTRTESEGSGTEGESTAGTLDAAEDAGDPGDTPSAQ